MNASPPNRAVMVVLAYLWLLALIPLTAAKDDPEIQWHARHGLVLLVAELALFVALWLAIGLLSLLWLAAGCAMGLLVVVAWIAILLVHFAAAIKGLRGERLIVPWVSNFAVRS